MTLTFTSFHVVLLKLYSVVAFSSCSSKFTNVATFVFPPQKIAASVTNVALIITYSFLIEITVSKHSAMIFAVDITHCNFVFYFS